LKAQSTQTFEYCAREAAQIFGGLSYSRGGWVLENHATGQTYFDL
jgi:alkylation response protein AidB-like acyl-CoA dehydrogenase